MSIVEHRTAEAPLEPPAPVAHAQLERAAALVSDPSIRVLSLDIFDTLLWRRIPEPVDAFVLQGDRLADRGVLAEHVTPQIFARLRELAERRARAVSRTAGRGVEVTLADIYGQMHPAVFADRLRPHELVATELEVEGDLLVPDLDVMELVRAAKAAGKRVVAVSDTYVTERDLRVLLEPYYRGELRIDSVFASNEHGEGKAEGLFDVVLAELGVQASEVVHVGDNPDSDIAPARSRGMHTVLFERRPKELREMLVRERPYTLDTFDGWNGDFGLSALRSKVLHRREATALPEELRPFWGYGAACIGPPLAGFAEWVQHRARGLGVTKVFCPMREGALLSDLVNLAGDYMGTAAEAGPVWLSRQVCARAAIVDGTREELELLMYRARTPTVGELCATLGVDASDVPAFCDRLDHPLKDAELRAEVFGELSSDPEVRTAIVGEASKLRRRVVEYVKRQLPAGESTFVLVDLGWAGTTQSLLQRILSHEGEDIRLAGLYLLTQEVALGRVADGVEMDGFIGRCGFPEYAVKPLIRSPEVLEQVCMPDVGSQVDLNSDLEPVLGEPHDLELMQSAERDAVQKGIRAFQREWARYQTLLPGELPHLFEGGAPAFLLATLARVLVAPRETEAAMFGRWLHDANFGSTGIEAIADARMAKAFRHMDPKALLAVPMSDVYWPFGVAALNDEHLADSAEAVATGRLSWEAFTSELETGPFDLYYDNGYGYGEAWKVELRPRRNRFGLSYVRETVGAEVVRGLRLDPTKGPAMLRLDWIALRCWVRGSAEPVELVFEQPADLERLSFAGLTQVRPKLFVIDGDDPQIDIKLDRLLDGEAYEVTVECAFAVLPAAPAPGPPPERERRRRRRVMGAKRAVRRLESRTGVQLGEPLRRGWRKLRQRGR